MNVVKITQGNDQYLKLLTDTNIVFGPILNTKNGGEGHIAVEMTKSSWNLLNAQLLPVFPKPINDVGQVDQGVFIGKKGGKWGIADTLGKWKAKPQFEAAEQFSEGIAFVSKKDLWGAADRNGDIIIEPKIKKTSGMPVLQFKEQRSVVVMNGLFYLMDKQGSILNEKGFKKITQPFHQRIFAISESGYDLFDLNGNLLKEENFEWIEDKWISNPVRVKNRMKFGFYDLKSDTLLVPCEFESLQPFKDGYAVIKDMKGFSFCDSNGNMFSNHWPYLKNLGKGLFAYSNQIGAERTVGLMDQFGKIIVPTSFIEINEFRGDWASALKNNQYVMIDEFGAPMVEEYFEKVYDYNAKYAIVGNGLMTWIIDNMGKIVVKATIAKIQFL